MAMLTPSRAGGKGSDEAMSVCGARLVPKTAAQESGAMASFEKLTAEATKAGAVVVSTVFGVAVTLTLETTATGCVRVATWPAGGLLAVGLAATFMSRFPVTLPPFTSCARTAEYGPVEMKLLLTAMFWSGLAEVMDARLRSLAPIAMPAKALLTALPKAVVYCSIALFRTVRF